MQTDAICANNASVFVAHRTGVNQRAITVFNLAGVKIRTVSVDTQRSIAAMAHNRHDNTLLVGDYGGTIIALDAESLTELRRATFDDADYGHGQILIHPRTNRALIVPAVQGDAHVLDEELGVLQTIPGGPYSRPCVAYDQHGEILQHGAHPALAHLKSVPSALTAHPWHNVFAAQIDSNIQLINADTGQVIDIGGMFVNSPDLLCWSLDGDQLHACAVGGDIVTIDVRFQPTSTGQRLAVTGTSRLAFDTPASVVNENGFVHGIAAVPGGVAVRMPGGIRLVRDVLCAVD